MRLILFVLVLFSYSFENSVLASTPTEEEKQYSALIPIEDIAAHPEFRGLGLSPNGERMFMTRRNGSDYKIVLGTIGLDGFKEERSIDVPSDVYAHGAIWADDDRLIIQYARYEGPLPKLLEHPSLDLYAVNYDGSDKIHLWSEVPKNVNTKRARNRSTTKVLFGISHLLSKEPDYVLLNRVVETSNKRGSLEKDRLTDVYRVNIRTAEMELITPKHHKSYKMSDWLTDYEGNIRLGFGENVNEKPILLIKKTKDSKWTRLDNHDLFSGGKFTPLQFGLDNDELYVIASHATGRSAVFRFDLASGKLAGRVFGHKKVDVSSINYSVKKGKVLAVNYYDEDFEREVLDEDFASFLANVDKATMADGNFTINSQSSDETKAIIWVGDERSMGTPWFYDDESKKAVSLGPVNPKIDPSKMAKMEAVTYSARDGLDIPAYLTLPLNYEKGTPLPAIVMPHGGPIVRDVKRWDTWVQFLANRGYVVLQPNFRGSSGYGWRFLALGLGEWGDDMQQDVADGAKWLVRQGYADKDKMCIVGGSYGGYASLMGIIQDADKFKCAVSWAPVTDLKLILEQDDMYDEDKFWYHAVTGGLKRKELRKISPRFMAKEMKSPLLLMHGDEDDVVYIEQSRLLVKEMKKAKVNFKYKEIEGLGHSFETEESMVEFLQEMEAFLTKYNPTVQLLEQSQNQ